MKKTLSAISLIISLLLPLLGMAEENTPASVAQAYSDAQANKNLLESAKYIRVADLKMFKDSLLPIYRAESNENKRDLLELTFGKDANISDVENSSEEQFYANFLNSVLTISDDMGIPFGDMGTSVLGTINEHKSLAHVVVRITVYLGGEKLESVDVITVSKEEGLWRIILPENIKKIMNLAFQTKENANNALKPTQ